MVSGARLFQQTFGMDYENALLIGAVSTILYVCIGGFLAVSWTDAVQASLMIFALVITPIIIILDVGSISEANALVSLKGPDMANLLKGTTVIGLISLAGWGLGYVGQPHILVRFMGGARRISISWMIFCLLGAVAVGYYGVAFAAKHPELTVDNPEQIFIIVTQTLFTPWIAGILLSAILAAIMSTLSCQLLVASTTLTADFYRRVVRPHASQTELVWIGRFMLLLVAAIAYIIALDPNSGILKLVSYAWAGFGAAFGPVVLCSLFWKRANKYGIISGMIAGGAMIFIWKFGIAKLGGIFAVYELLPAFIFATLVIIVVSLATGKPSKEVMDKFEEVKNMSK